MWYVQSPLLSCWTRTCWEFPGYLTHQTALTLQWPVWFGPMHEDNHTITAQHVSMKYAIIVWPSLTIWWRLLKWNFWTGTMTELLSDEGLNWYKAGNSHFSSDPMSEWLNLVNLLKLALILKLWPAHSLAGKLAAVKAFLTVSPNLCFDKRCLVLPLKKSSWVISTSS